MKIAVCAGIQYTFFGEPCGELIQERNREWAHTNIHKSYDHNAKPKRGTIKEGKVNV